jgi:hypothetical protein
MQLAQLLEAGPRRQMSEPLEIRTSPAAAVCVVGEPDGPMDECI